MIFTNKITTHIKKFKEITVENNENFVPMILVVCDQKIKAIIGVPNGNRDELLSLCKLCKSGMDPDEIFLIFDANYRSLKKEEAEKIDLKNMEMKERLQDIIDRGEAEKYNVSETLMCFSIDKNLKFSSKFFPYKHVDNKIIWTEDEKADGEPLKMGGVIPEELTKIMQSQSFILDEIKELREIFQEKHGFDEEKMRFHTARAIVCFMVEKGCLVKEFISLEHPEWLNLEWQIEQGLSELMESGRLPREARGPLKELAEKYLLTKDFASQLEKLLKEKIYWLPASWRNADGLRVFSYDVESTFLMPRIPSLKDLENYLPKDLRQDLRDLQKDLRQQEGKRVEVWNGDRSQYLGKGRYVGDVTTYAILDADGALRSMKNAEKKPTKVPEGCEISELPNNPKIILDDGTVVYGCQVWWNYVAEQKDFSYNK